MVNIQEWIEKSQTGLSNFRKSESWILKKLREIKAYSQVLLQKNQIPEQKFVIFAYGRSGSTLLVKLLNNHQKIHCEEEILHSRFYGKMLFPSLYVQGRAVKFSSKVYGFKVKIFQLAEEQNIDPEKFLLNLYRDRWKIIYLKRNNILRSQISALLGISRNQMHATSKSKLKNKKIIINCEQLLVGLQRREIYQIKEQEILKNLDHIKVIYEEDLLLTENHQKTSDRIFNYLGLDSVPVKTNLVKTTSNQLSDVIENYEEVVEKLSQTKYAKFLHD